MLLSPPALLTSSLVPPPQAAPLILNEEVLMSSALDDIEFAMELIEVFRLTTGPTLAQFEDAVTSENWQAAALHSHTVKGSARTLGLDYLGQTCGRLESWARANADGDFLPRPASPGLLKASHQTALDALDRFAHSQ